MNIASASLDIDAPDLAAAVERLEPEGINTLPFGAIRLDPEFHRLYKEIWSRLRAEVQKTYGAEDFPS